MRQDIRGRQKCRRRRDTSKRKTLVLYENRVSNITPTKRLQRYAIGLEQRVKVVTRKQSLLRILCYANDSALNPKGLSVRVRNAMRFKSEPLSSYWLSNKERRVDALALRADERRDKLRKASGSCK